MQRTLAWGSVFGVWMLGVLGSAYVIFLELSDGSPPGKPLTIAAGVHVACVLLAFGYWLGVPRDRRPSPFAWLVAVGVCVVLATIIGFAVLMVAMRGAIRG